MKIKAIDLFSGCGGVSCGLTRAGFTVGAAVEIEQDAVNTYLGYPPLSKVNVLVKDISTVSGSELIKAAGIKKEDLYLLAGCPPCQNFSIQNPNNKKKSEDERKKMLVQYLRIVRELHPPFILMENVPGITTDFNASILNEFVEKLENKHAKAQYKYKLFKAVVNAADFGVPQFRKRFVLHGIRLDIWQELLEAGGSFDLPRPTHNCYGQNGLPLWITVEQSIGDLPPIKAGETYHGELLILNHKCANLSPKNLEKIRYIRLHGGSRSCLPDNMVLDCHRKNGKAFNGHKDVYGIMERDKPSPTMTGGCLFYTKGRYGHYSQDRAISIREAARLQTFPDDFQFPDSLATAALQIGNAVPVRLVEASADVFLSAIRLIYKHRKKKPR